MLSAELNETLTRTDPGTPMGDLMRRYWQPVSLSKEVTPGGKPKQLKVMSEDLVLFRDDAGRPALLGQHCSHRLTSLAYGRVEGGGIRCPFHGWLFDPEGRCLEQPAEPEGSTFKDKVRHKAYPCEDLGGLIFAYMGPPEKQPLLPRYEILVREDGSRHTNWYPINSNYLQNVEGALDTVHFSYLHMDPWSKIKHRRNTLVRPRLDIAEAPYGIWQRSDLPNLMTDSRALVYGHFFMPTGFMRIQEHHAEQGVIQKFQSWYVPADDEHTMRFQVAFTPCSVTNGKRWEYPPDDEFLMPGPENDYFREYETTDTISGIPTRTKNSNIKGFLSQDSMVNETQGYIVPRQKEHLGAQDHVLTFMRRMLLKAIDQVRTGEDPKFIIRDPAANEVVVVNGDEPQERV